MNKYLTAFCVCVAVVGCSVARGEESADSGAPTRVSGLVRWAEYVSLDIGDYGDPQEVRVTDGKFIAAVAQVLDEAKYFKREHSFSISPALFVFYGQGKMLLSVSLQPGSVLRLVTAGSGEENFAVSKTTISALIKLRATKTANRSSLPAPSSGAAN